MFKDIVTIIKKECARFFKDKRTAFMAILFPGLLIYALYSIMGTGMSDMTSIPEDYTFPCYVQNLPESFAPAMDLLGFNVTQTNDIAYAKQQVANKKSDLVVVFPADFDAQIAQAAEGVDVPNIQVYYNGDRNQSYLAYERFTEQANLFEDMYANVLDINKNVSDFDLANGTSFIMSMMPMLVIMLLFSGCQSIAPESIAGEKERGTIATLLVTPTSRTSIAIGKVASLSLFATLSGLSSFVGLVFSMPKMLGDAMQTVNLNLYGTTEYLCLLAVILSAVLFNVAILSVISAYAKSVKEATTTTTIVMLLATMTGMIPTLSLIPNGIAARCIPMVNSALSLHDIFMLDYSVTNIAVTCASNVVAVAGLVVVLSKMFNSEKIMFNKA